VILILRRRRRRGRVAQRSPLNAPADLSPPGRIPPLERKAGHLDVRVPDLDHPREETPGLTTGGPHLDVEEALSHLADQTGTDAADPEAAGDRNLRYCQSSNSFYVCFCVASSVLIGS